MDLHPEEPELRAVAGGGRRRRCSQLVGRPSLVLVDGRGGGGKTTFSSRLADLLGASLVHTDDVAWEHSRFGWDDAAASSSVIEPWRRGAAVELPAAGVGGARARRVP